MGDSIHKPEKFRVVLGNTDRSAAELLSYLRRHAPDLAGVHIEPVTAKPAKIGEVVFEFHIPCAHMSESQLNAILSQVSECMYQVETLERI
ncbi:hypothetical protein [Azotosporobacter soli]|uniref:hypothetical protein n=1 Tax=Azotosporobacter soli TaxID=3055040 RepID=UPI0031FECA30